MYPSDVCVFVDTQTSSLSETGQFMSSTFYIPHKREGTSGSQEKQTFKISALLKLLARKTIIISE